MLFSIDNYKQIIFDIVKSDRKFSGFEDEPLNTVYLRFDVDYDLEWAAILAEINRELSVTGTFFIQIASPLYNIFSEENREAILKIQNAGQLIGLHFDNNGKKMPFPKLEEAFTILRSVTNKIVPVISWHNPCSLLTEWNRELSGSKYISTYSNKYFGKDIYVSDSNGINSCEDIRRFIKKSAAPGIQILLHPFNWIAEGDTINEILSSTFDYKLRKLHQYFKQNSVWADGYGDMIYKSLGLSQKYL